MTQRWVALIAGIGGKTHRAMRMADLRDGCRNAGFARVETVLATGNVIFDSPLDKAATMLALNAVIADHGLDNAVILRRPADLVAAREANPFPDAARARPDHLLLHVLNDPAPEGALGDWDGPERIAVAGRDVYIHYVEGVGGSKLTSPRLTRALRQVGTARNWNTVGRLIGRAEAD
jgi:uncharacterized protein (DUF1697 family)